MHTPDFRRTDFREVWLLLKLSTGTTRKVKIHSHLPKSDHSVLVSVQIAARRPIVCGIFNQRHGIVSTIMVSEVVSKVVVMHLSGQLQGFNGLCQRSLNEMKIAEHIPRSRAVVQNKFDLRQQVSHSRLQRSRHNYSCKSILQWHGTLCIETKKPLIDENCARALTFALSYNIPQIEMVSTISSFKFSWFQTMLISETAADFRVFWFQTTETYFLSLIDENCARLALPRYPRRSHRFRVFHPFQLLKSSWFQTMLISETAADFRVSWFQTAKTYFRYLQNSYQNQHFMTCAHWSNHSSQRKQTSQTHLKLLASASLLLQFAV